MHTSTSHFGLAATLAVLLLAGCASSENASSEKKGILDGQPIYEKDEVDRPPTPLSSAKFEFSYRSSSREPQRLRDARVHFVVNTEGEPVRIRMSQSTGNRNADHSIQRGIAKQQYVPGVLNGEVVPVRLTRSFNFSR